MVGACGGTHDRGYRGIVSVAQGLRGSLKSSEHCLLSQLPQPGCFLGVCFHVDFKVREVVDQRDSSRKVGDGEHDDISGEALGHLCVRCQHFPGAGLRVVWGEEVGHYAAEHSHQGTAVGEVQGQSSQLADSVEFDVD